MLDDNLALLRLLQLADSAAPIGAMVHSFGLETLVTDNLLTVDALEAFFADYIQEAATLDAFFCRTAYKLAGAFPDCEPGFEQAWINLNQQISAFKPARESRTASALLGKRFLRLAFDFEQEPLLAQALQTGARRRLDTHYSAAFGLVGATLELGEDAAALAFLQQSLIGLVSVCQRLLPLGQSQASRITWRLKPNLIAAAKQSRVFSAEDLCANSFMPIVDVAAMRHPVIHTRLFMS